MAIGLKNFGKAQTGMAVLFNQLIAEVVRRQRDVTTDKDFLVYTAMGDFVNGDLRVNHVKTKHTISVGTAGSGMSHKG